MLIGILGYGSIGQRHANNARALGHDIMIWDPACSPTHPRASVLRLADAIVISSPTTEHWRDIIDCVDSQKPMLIEKPITHPDMHTLLDTLTCLGEGDVPAFMGFNLRFHSCVQKAKEWLPQLGTIIFSEFTVFQKTTKEAYLRDGVISNWLSHEFDIILWLLGPGKVIKTNVDKAETMANVKIKHESRATTHAFADYITDPEIRGFRIVGINGMIRVDLVDRTAIMWIGEEPPVEFHGTDDWDQNYADELKDWIEQIQGCDGRCAHWSDGIETELLVIKARELGGLCNGTNTPRGEKGLSGSTETPPVSQSKSSSRTDP